MAKRKIQRSPKKPARKPPKKASSKKAAPRRRGKKTPPAAPMPPVKLDKALHQSVINFLENQKLSDIVGLWNDLRQCKPKGNVVAIPGLHAVELVRYIEQTQPIVQLYLRLRSVTPAPAPAADPPDESASDKAS